MTPWIPIFSGMLGILGVLAGTWITQRSTRKREDSRWERERELDRRRYERERLDRQREIRSTLYLDLAEFAQDQHTRLESVTDEYGSGVGKGPEVRHPDQLTARVMLHAAPPIAQLWTKLLKSIDAVRWESTEGDVNHGANRIWLDPDNPAVLEMKNSIEELKSALRSAIEDEASATPTGRINPSDY
ncbi:hypothetical protein O7608_13380 [Solwaraspora sp. WMMA2056]|uniref:hypothetical protein n=1 Tax=Solwaraspora sp. WMMA2056 TaxID=3015161 RepID=UPI00259B93E5|nr:hypothetical protein [Solwaraspora sp. WMMA2056]WJK43303.1 hypothetical protein O7608_13380 [Solwaraspora sp. WMMA2056]